MMIRNNYFNKKNNMIRKLIKLKDKINKFNIKLNIKFMFKNKKNIYI